ncbi:MAG TPA: hypothetical protein VF466_02790 [Candidatus Saccharimonadales bacterium]
MSFLGTLFGTPKTASLGGAKSPLELVTAAAALVSDPQHIDPLLDRVRAITAKLQPGEQPGPTDTAVLLQTYVGIEAYLTANEPLRAFTKEDLRRRLDPELRIKIETYEAKG